MTEIDDNIKFGMVDAISHLIHRDYEAIVEDFVTLQFIDPGTNLTPILPVLAKVCRTVFSLTVAHWACGKGVDGGLCRLCELMFNCTGLAV